MRDLTTTNASTACCLPPPLGCRDFGKKLLFRAWLPISCFIAAIIFPACIFFHSTLWHNSPSFLQATKLKRVANFEQLNSSSSATSASGKSSTFFTQKKKLKRPANKAQFYCELRTRATLSPCSFVLAVCDF